ncbi:hypothetical protein ACHAXM_002775 [Skeletonema potamos]|jgi:hypothetical protein
MISAPSFAATAVALHMMMYISHAAAAELPLNITDLTCSSDEMKMTTGLLTSCDDSDMSCETKCTSATCNDSGKLEYEYIVPVGGDLLIDCSASEDARCCLNSFFESLFGSISNTGLSTAGGATTCDTTDEVMFTEASLVFCNSTVYGTCFIECSDGCNVTSPNSEMTKETYFAIETPQGQDFDYDCTEEGAFCCVDMSDWKQAGPETPATSENTVSATPKPPKSSASLIQTASLTSLVVGYCFVIIV